jgi:hypothetical protein
MRLGLLQVACLTHSGRVGRPRRRSNSSNSVQQPFWRVPQTQSARPSHKRKTSAIFQYEAIRPLEPSASVRRNAVHDLGYPHNAACLKLCGIQPVVDARLLVDLQGSMDENRPSVIGGPTSVLDVLCGSMPRMGSNVSREPSDHRPSRNVSGSAVANCDLPIRDYFPKSRKRSDQKQLATGWRH